MYRKTILVLICLFFVIAAFSLSRGAEPENTGLREVYPNEPAHGLFFAQRNLLLWASPMFYSIETIQRFEKECQKKIEKERGEPVGKVVVAGFFLGPSMETIVVCHTLWVGTAGRAKGVCDKMGWDYVDFTREKAVCQVPELKKKPVLREVKF